MLMHYGKETMLSRGDMPHMVRVVLTLVEGLDNQGYDLYVDRFYTSPLLATELEKVGITITGTQYQVGQWWKGWSSLVLGFYIKCSLQKAWAHS